MVIPPFARGSGGHTSIFQMMLRFERMGHTCSIWVHDPLGWHSYEQPAVLRRRVVEEFAPVEAPVFKEFEHWYGADVVVATGWETAYPVMLLPRCRARAYLIHDHEPEFFATSAHSLWAERTYSFDLFPIAGSDVAARPDRGALRAARRPGSASASTTTSTGRLPVERDRDTVIFYSRDATPRRAVPLGLLALDELWRRRPGRAHRPVRRRRADQDHVPAREPRRRLDRTSWPGATTEATVGLSACRSPTTR